MLLPQILANSGHLGYCYSLLENVIEHLTAGPSLQLDDKQVVQLHSAMVGAFNGVIQFLDLVSNQTVTEVSNSRRSGSHSTVTYEFWMAVCDIFR